MCYEDDFYYEPSEFDQQVEEFKASLIKSVKEEFLQRMEALEKENAALRKFRDEKEAFIRDCENRVAKAQREARMAEEKWKTARLHQLLGDSLGTGWKVGYKMEYAPKCDKCDDNRYLHFLSPQGNPCKEICKCAKYTTRYFPQEATLSKMYVRKRNFPPDSVRIDWRNRYYTVDQKRNDDCDVYEVATDVYEPGFVCEKVQNVYRAVFLTEEDCQRYCDWLNEQEAKKRAKEG